MLVGEATKDATLFEAGVERARGLIAAVGNDRDNVFITLSARRINPNLVIVARSTSSETVDKLEIAGADRVVSSFEIGCRRMAMAALRPLAVDVFDSLAEGSSDG
jgi:voltage-gated potassium channel